MATTVYDSDPRVRRITSGKYWVGGRDNGDFDYIVVWDGTAGWRLEMRMPNGDWVLCSTSTDGPDALLQVIIGPPQ